jgi:hypothetical protein
MNKIILKIFEKYKMGIYNNTNIEHLLKVIPSLETNLVAYWKLNNTSDSVGSKTLTNNGSVTFVPGKIGDGADFGSSNSSKYLSLPGGLMSGSNAFSISCWIKTNSSVSKSVFQYGDLTSGAYFSMGTAGASTGYVQANFFGGSGSVTGTTNVHDGSWHYIVVTFSGGNGNLKIYVDGSIQNTGAAYTPNIVDGSGYRFIAFVGSFAEYWSGMVDEFGIWSRAITSDEVTILYLNGSGNQYPFSFLTTSSVTNISLTSATGGGNVIFDGGATVIERGVVINTSPTPTTSNTKFITSGTTGEYTVNMTSLTSGVTYYVRAFFRNANGTFYGNEVE